MASRFSATASQGYWEAAPLSRTVGGKASALRLSWIRAELQAGSLPLSASQCPGLPRCSLVSICQCYWARWRREEL